MDRGSHRNDIEKEFKLSCLGGIGAALFLFTIPVGGAFRDVIGVIASERVLVENTSVAAVDDARVVVDASHQTAARIWSGHRVTRERRELARQRVGRQTGHFRAPESHHFFGIAAVFEEEIGPVARMGALVVSQSFLASDFFGFAESAADEVQIAAGRSSEQTERVLAVRRAITTRFRLQFVNSLAAVSGPVIVAVFVNGAFAVEEKTIAARLQSQRSVGAFVELVTVLRVGVQLQTERFRARADLHITGPNFTTGG